MQNTVTRLKPRSADYETALGAYFSGNVSFCIDALSTDTTSVANALRARAFLRAARYVDVIELANCAGVEQMTHEYAAELLVLKAFALLAMRDEDCEFALTEARARAFSSGFRPLECEVEFVAAVAAWTFGRNKESLAAINRVLDISDLPPIFMGRQREDYIYNTAYWRSRAHDLRGLLEAGREDYAAQAQSIILALSEFDESYVKDSFISAKALMNLAYLVRDLDSPQLATYVEARADLQIWTADTKDQEFVVFHALGLCRAKRGDHLGALRSLRRSANCAPTVPLQISAILDRSLLARELGEVLSAEDDLDHAMRLARQIDWEHAVDSQRSVLYQLARQLSSVDVQSARVFWNRYCGLKTSFSALELAARGDRRVRAEECTAHAAVLVAEGQQGRAVSLLLECLEIWTDVGYFWRAAAVALELAELTGEPRYVEIAAREAAKQPNSWLARRVAALKVPATI